MKNSDIFQFILNDINLPNQKAYLDFFPAIYNSKSASDLYKLADALIHTLLFPYFGATYMIKSLLSSFFQFLSAKNQYYTTQITLDSKADFLLFCRISHILEDTNGRITRHELEKSINYTSDYLNRIIKKYSGMSLFDYGMTFCLEKAASLLKNTDIGISDIILELKFTNRTHFYKLFKDKYGMTPKEYRQKNKR